MCMRDQADFQKEIDRLLASYIQETTLSALKPLSRQTYQTQAINFVRWIKREFQPGVRKRQEL